MSKLIAHASSICIKRGARWYGVLISGASGVGKSDLSLRALHEGFRLVADDYSLLWLSGPEGAKRVFARAPDTIAERMEIRGIGIVSHAARRSCAIDLVVHCQNDPIERMPEAEVTPILGHPLPTLRLDPREASAVAKLLTRLTLLPKT
jgi:serine kinase of HPr protein (carbohydrate metabolism regulator)